MPQLAACHDLARHVPTPRLDEGEKRLKTLLKRRQLRRWQGKARGASPLCRDVSVADFHSPACTACGRSAWATQGPVLPVVSSANATRRQCRSTVTAPECWAPSSSAAYLATRTFSRSSHGVAHPLAAPHGGENRVNRCATLPVGLYRCCIRQLLHPYRSHGAACLHHLQ